MKNLPNFITIIRIGSIPLFIFLLVHDYDMYALYLFILVGVSDALDGFIARTWNLKTRLGSYLDPIADKFLLLSSFITLVLLSKIEGWITLIVVGRDILLGILGIILLKFIDLRTYKIRPSVIGKVTTVMQIITILLVLSGNKGTLFSVILWITAFATISSGLHYIYRESKIFWT